MAPVPPDHSVEAYQIFKEAQKSWGNYFLNKIGLGKRLGIKEKEVVCTWGAHEEGVDYNIVNVWHKLISCGQKPSDLHVLAPKVVKAIQNKGSVDAYLKHHDTILNPDVKTVEKISHIYTIALQSTPLDLQNLQKRFKNSQQISDAYRELFVKKENVQELGPIVGKTTLEFIHEKHPELIDKIKKDIADSKLPSAACRNLLIDKSIELPEYLPFCKLAADLIPFVEKYALDRQDPEKLAFILERFAALLDKGAEYTSTTIETIFAILLSATTEAHSLSLCALDANNPIHTIIQKFNEQQGLPKINKENIISLLAEYHIQWINTVKNLFSDKTPWNLIEKSFNSLPRQLNKQAFFTPIIKCALQQAETLPPIAQFDDIVKKLMQVKEVPKDLLTEFQKSLPIAAFLQTLSKSNLMSAVADNTQINDKELVPIRSEVQQIVARISQNTVSEREQLALNLDQIIAFFTTNLNNRKDLQDLLDQDGNKNMSHPFWKLFYSAATPFLSATTISLEAQSKPSQLLDTIKEKINRDKEALLQKLEEALQQKTPDALDLASYYSKYKKFLKNPETALKFWEWLFTHPAAFTKETVFELMQEKAPNLAKPIVADFTTGGFKDNISLGMQRCLAEYPELLKSTALSKPVDLLFHQLRAGLLPFVEKNNVEDSDKREISVIYISLLYHLNELPEASRISQKGIVEEIAKVFTSFSAYFPQNREVHIEPASFKEEHFIWKLLNPLFRAKIPGKESEPPQMAETKEQIQQQILAFVNKPLEKPPEILPDVSATPKKIELEASAVKIPDDIQKLLARFQDRQQIGDAYTQLFATRRGVSGLDKTEAGKTPLQVIHEKQPQLIDKIKHYISASELPRHTCTNLLIDKGIQLLNQGKSEYLPFCKLAVDVMPFAETELLDAGSQEALISILQTFATTLDTNRIYNSAVLEEIFAFLLSATWRVYLAGPAQGAGYSFTSIIHQFNITTPLEIDSKKVEQYFPFLPFLQKLAPSNFMNTVIKNEKIKETDLKNFSSEAREIFTHIEPSTARGKMQIDLNLGAIIDFFTAYLDRCQDLSSLLDGASNANMDHPFWKRFYGVAGPFLDDKNIRLKDELKPSQLVDTIKEKIAKERTAGFQKLAGN